MPITLSQRVQSIKPSPTLAVSAKANELKATGKDIISLGAGEPDFDTPEHIKNAAIRAIHDGHTKYTAVDGIIELKTAIVEKFQRENNIQYDLTEVSVAAGAKHSLYNLFQATLNPQDEVIIPAPYWVSYPDMVRLSQAVPNIINTDINHQFKITPKQLHEAINDKTRMLIINSPANPTGQCYNKDELAQLGEVLLAHPNILIVTDDIYEHILWGEQQFYNMVNACPDLKDRCVVINGVSKAYAMTGWRIGYAGGNCDLIKAMNKIQSQSTSNPNSIAQYAATAALTGDQTCIQENTALFKQRHDFVVQSLQEIDDIDCLPAMGAFYAFPNMTALIKKLQLNNDIELSEFFLYKAQVSMVPGSAFGAEGYLRISYATSLDNLKTAITRLKQCISENI